MKINKEIPVTLELKELASAQSIAALFHDLKSGLDCQQGGGVMGALRRKRALLKKVTSFNLYADQWAQIQENDKLWWGPKTHVWEYGLVVMGPLDLFSL